MSKRLTGSACTQCFGVLQAVGCFKHVKKAAFSLLIGLKVRIALIDIFKLKKKSM